ncbi:MAG: class I SAM-dependent methyltransferase [Candidatus Binatia bacterium]|nr:class I SAM-dependent methyltransferase [Candidatus Binatia bacterium]
MRARIYDAAILPLTTSWYAAVLDRVPDGAAILDVGIGTGGALAANADLVQRKDLRVIGIDIDRDYIARCNALLTEKNLSERVEARLESVYDHKGGPYEAIYFSASFMLLPDPRAALDHVRPMLAPTGHFYFTQTFENERSALMERLKPMLRTLTTIDFGRVTYEDDFRTELQTANVDLVEMVKLGGTRSRSYHIAVARPGS